MGALGKPSGKGQARRWRGAAFPGPMRKRTGWRAEAGRAQESDSARGSRCLCFRNDVAAMVETTFPSRPRSEACPCDRALANGTKRVPRDRPPPRRGYPVLLGPLPRSLAPGGVPLADVVVLGGRCGREAWSPGCPGKERRTRPLAASRWFGFSVPQQDPIRGVTERGRGGAMGAGLGSVGAAGGWARGRGGLIPAGSVSCCPIGVWASRPAPAPCPPGLAWRWQERACSRPPRASQPGLG